MNIKEINELIDRAKADYDETASAGPAAFESVDAWFSELDRLSAVIYECEARLDAWFQIL